MIQTLRHMLLDKLQELLPEFLPLQAFIADPALIHVFEPTVAPSFAVCIGAQALVPHLNKPDIFTANLRVWLVIPVDGDAAFYPAIESAYATLARRERLSDGTYAIAPTEVGSLEATPPHTMRKADFSALHFSVVFQTRFLDANLP